MYVSSEVRRRELPESSPDATPYASAAAGASFMAILTEVSNRSTGTSAGQTPDEGAEAAGVSAVSDAPDETSEAPEESPDARPVTLVEEGQEAGEMESTRSTATESSPESNGDEATETGNSIAVSAAPAGAATPPGAVATEEGSTQPDAELDGIADTANDGSSAIDLVEISTDGVDPDPGTSEVAKPVTALHLDDAEASVALTDSNAEVAPAATVETFPKTLNAIIAEGALRQGTDKLTETSPRQPELEDLTEVATEPVGEQPLPEVPDAPPLPQAAALESGGVRPQATGLPRLPMANLPGELAQQLNLMQQEGTRTMRLSLVPENLGELQIEIQGTGDTMRVRLISGNPAVRDALESQMGALKDAMQKQGLALDNATVDSGASRREATPEQDRRSAAPPHRAATRALETSVGGIRATTPLALGSSALNILA